MKSERFKFKVGDVLNDPNNPILRIVIGTEMSDSAGIKSYKIAYWESEVVNTLRKNYVEDGLDFYLVFCGGKKVISFLKLFGCIPQEK